MTKHLGRCLFIVCSLGGASWACDDAPQTTPLGAQRVNPPQTPPTAAGAPGQPAAPSAGGTAPSPFDPSEAAVVRPPPISGGSLLVSRDGQLLVAADPDRDRLYFVDLPTRALKHVQQLARGDEPGRLIEDAAGRFHVALRSGRAVATLSREPDAPVTRRALCELPRGLAYDATRDQIHVACAEGRLVSAPADPEAPAVRALDIERDARDVLVRDDGLFVSLFRRSELLRFDAAGALLSRYVPAPMAGSGVAAGTSTTPRPSDIEPPPNELTSNGAWRTLDVAGKGVVMLHQRALHGRVPTSPGGYGRGGSGCTNAIVESALTLGLDTDKPRSVDLTMATLAVDLAVDRAGTLLAIAAPGLWNASGALPQIQLFVITGSSTLNVYSPAPPPGPSSGPVLQPPSGPSPCVSFDLPKLEDPVGQATAVAFVAERELAVLSRDPATIDFFDVSSGRRTASLDLGQPILPDAGHALFHLRAGAGIACASCHLEGGDDAHVWTFDGIGDRRTQSLRGGLLGTEPLHWNGDMRDFSQLVHDVFVGRMASDFEPIPSQVDALARWIDQLPALTAAARDPAAAERGEALFNDAAVGCNECHAGPHLTNNRSVDVGTGALLQVPSLHGVSFRAPFMHDGCAPTLDGRFAAACGGGDAHGKTSQLGSAQLADLVAYLETL